MLDIVLFDTGIIPDAIHHLPHATNWHQWKVGHHILVINLQLEYIGDEHLDILNQLYKENKIAAWAWGDLNSSRYNH